MMRLRFWRKKVESGCECEEYCPCDSDNMPRCEKCEYYEMIDSGHGHCIALPVVAIVPWCRVTCSLFEKRRKI